MVIASSDGSACSHASRSSPRADAYFALPGSFTCLDHVELHVVELAVHPLDLADVDVLHDVARLRVDQHRAARALEDLALHRVEQRLAAPAPLVAFERLVDHAHAVVAAHRHEVGPQLVVGLREGLDELLVGRRVVRGRVVVRGDDAERDVAHVVELSSSVTSPVAISRMPALSRPRSANCFMNGRARARGHEHEQRIGLGIAHLLQERREVGVAQRHAQLVEHLAAVELELVLEGLLGVDARAVVGDQRHDLLDAVLGAPSRRCATVDLRQREAGAHDERRGLGDARRGRRHHHHRRLATGWRSARWPAPAA